MRPSGKLAAQEAEATPTSSEDGVEISDLLKKGIMYMYTYWIREIQYPYLYHNYNSFLVVLLVNCHHRTQPELLCAVKEGAVCTLAIPAYSH